MTRQQKVESLLKWNRTNNTTFESRARDARRICSADDQGLDFMLAAVEA